MPTTPQAQDYGEPWSTRGCFMYDRDGRFIISDVNPRIVDCVSACASIHDPQQAIAAAREALKAASERLLYHAPLDEVNNLIERTIKLLQPND